MSQATHVRHVWHLGGDRYTFPIVGPSLEVAPGAWRQPHHATRDAVLAARQTNADYLRALAAPAFADAFTESGKLRKGWRMVGAVPTCVSPHAAGPARAPILAEASGYAPVEHDPADVATARRLWRSKHPRAFAPDGTLRAGWTLKGDFRVPTPV